MLPASNPRRYDTLDRCPCPPQKMLNILCLQAKTGNDAAFAARAQAAADKHVAASGEGSGTQGSGDASKGAGGGTGKK